MRTFNTYYTDLSQLGLFIEDKSIINNSSLLIQIFTSSCEISFIAKLQKFLNCVLPSASVIGCTTDGEIMNGAVSTYKTVLSFTQFDNTKLETYIIQHKNDGYHTGKSIAENITKDTTKLLIIFADGISTNGDQLISGLDSVNKEIVIAGGLAGDNGEFKRTFVFDKKSIMEKGAVAVALDNPNLHIFSDYNFNWRTMGRELTITKSKGNRVYSIGNRSAVDTYKHYLGDEISRLLPVIGIEFPLISNISGIDVARAAIEKHDDGSISFAGDIKEGEKVHFGYGDPAEILKSANKIPNTLSTVPVESIFIYSCMARRRFMPNSIDLEVTPLDSIAPTAGFFTYGEFYSDTKKVMLNQSMTMIALSESRQNKIRKLLNSSHTKSKKSSTINALINLIDVTSKEALEEKAINEARIKFETLFQQSADGIVLLDGHNLVQCNKKIVELFGYNLESEFLNLRPRDLSPLHQDDGNLSVEKISMMKDIAVKHGSHLFEWRFQKSNGDKFWADVMLTKMQLDNQDIIYAVCRDITERKAMELQLIKQKNNLFIQANHDSLTSLPNRNYFIRELNKAILSTDPDNESITLMFIDLDRLKTINDSLGHDIGDIMIISVSSRIKNLMRNNDMVARLGGDEFLIMLKGKLNTESIIKIATNILAKLREPIEADGHHLYTSASIGICTYPNDGKDSSTSLLKHTDTAMYKAKALGGDTFQFYHTNMSDNLYERVVMEGDLRFALENEDFEVYYQPQIDMRRGELIGMEALVRWRHPTSGIVAPYLFLPLMKEAGLMGKLDNWVMKTAMKQVSDWYKEGLNPGVLALNTEMKELNNKNIIKNISKYIVEFDFNPKWLEIEITETDVMTNPANVISILDSLHKLGIRIAIDDFGTGHSSLSHLKKLPIDKLKIDKSFIFDIPDDKDATAIVNTMIALSDILDMDIIAEGVETDEQASFFDGIRVPQSTRLLI